MQSGSKPVPATRAAPETNLGGSARTRGRRHRTWPIAALAALLAVVVLIVVLATVHDRSPSPVRLKPVVTGAIDRHAKPSAAAQAAGVTKWVVQLRWRTLQPDSPTQALQAGAMGQGGTADLDAAIRAAGSAASALKIRVYAGTSAPDWAKRLGGGPIPLGTAGKGSTVGVFWSSDYVRAYADLVTLLGKRYDDTRQIGEFVICESGVVYCDGTKQMNKSNAAAYLSHHYTERADIAAQKAAIDAFARTFTHTRSSQAFFPFQYVDANGKVGHDYQAMYEVMDYGKKVLGKRWVEENNSASDIRESVALYLPLWNRLRVDAAAGWPTEYQTASLNGIRNLCATLQWLTVTQRAVQVELPVGYDKTGGCPLAGANSIQHWGDQLLTTGAKLV